MNIQKIKPLRRNMRFYAALAAILALGLTACAPSPAASATPQPLPEPSLAATPAPTPTPKLETPVPTEEPSPEPVSVSEEPEGFFAIADKDGTRLIVLGSNALPMTEAPETLDIAIGYGGSVTPLRYLGYQEGDLDAWDGRETFYSFDNIPGQVYEASGGGLDVAWPYLITSAEAFFAQLISLEYNRMDEYSFVQADAVATAQREAGRGLAVVYSAELAATGEGGAIELFQYERSGDDMLFEIVYRNGAQEIVVEFPAEYDEYSTWRAGAGDHPGLWDVLFLARLEEQLLMATLWSGPEGGNVRIWMENGGIWEQLESMGAYMYWF